MTALGRPRRSHRRHAKRRQAAAELAMQPKAAIRRNCPAADLLPPRSVRKPGGSAAPRGAAYWLLRLPAAHAVRDIPLPKTAEGASLAQPSGMRGVSGKTGGRVLPRHRSKLIGRELVADVLVMRYPTAAGSDGLPADEGAFLVCSFWLAASADRGADKRFSGRSGRDTEDKEYRSRARRCTVHDNAMNSPTDCYKFGGPTEKPPAKQREAS
jgi:hypothetical protein